MDQPDDRIPVTAVLADNQYVARHGTRAVLEQAPGVSLVAETGSGTQALELIKEHRPDILIIEMVLPDMSGIQIAKELSKSKLGIPVLAFSAYEEEAYIRHTLENGIAGYVLKQDPPQLLVEAIRAVARGETNWMSPRVAREARKLETGKQEVRDAGISPRQWEVLILLAKGLTAQNIADRLHIEKTTVRTHLRHIYKKLDVKGYHGALAWAARQGLLDE